jgi:hypothetical protein
MKSLTILQATAGVGMPEIIILFLGIAFFALIFLAVRSVMLWYWKINDIISNQQEQTAVMQRQNLLIEQQTQILKELKAQIGNNPDGTDTGQ